MRTPPPDPPERVATPAAAAPAARRCWRPGGGGPQPRPSVVLRLLTWQTRPCRSACGSRWLPAVGRPSAVAPRLWRCARAPRRLGGAAPTPQRGVGHRGLVASLERPLRGGRDPPQGPRTAGIRRPLAPPFPRPPPPHPVQTAARGSRPRPCRCPPGAARPRHGGSGPSASGFAAAEPLPPVH